MDVHGGLSKSAERSGMGLMEHKKIKQNLQISKIFCNFVRFLIDTKYGYTHFIYRWALESDV
jgi:hypothetical protein